MIRTALILALVAVTAGCIPDPVRPTPVEPVKTVQTFPFPLFPTVQNGTSKVIRLKTNAVLTDMTTAFYVYPTPQFAGWNMWLSEGVNRVANGSPLAIHSSALKPATVYELHVQNMTGQPLSLGVGWMTVGSDSTTWIFNLNRME